MARIVDKTKIERLKKSTMKLVVEKGYGGASAMMIAKDARIASGYFYMHYKGKYELVNSLLHDVYQEIVVWFQELIENETSFSKIVELLIRNFIELANKQPDKIKFLYVLSNDYSFVLDDELYKITFELIDQAMEVGIKTGELDENIKNDDLYLILLICTIQFINQRFKTRNGKLKITRKDEEQLLYIIKKALS